MSRREVRRSRNNLEAGLTLAGVGRVSGLGLDADGGHVAGPRAGPGPRALHEDCPRVFSVARR